MGFNYGQRSKSFIETLQPPLQKVLYRAIEIIDITILCGRRDKGEQDSAFERKVSGVRWPDSAHNVLVPTDKAWGFDAMPYTPGVPGGVDWRTDKEMFAALKAGNMREALEILENIKRIKMVSGLILGIAYEQGIRLVNGSDWDGDLNFMEHTLKDSPHYQPINWKGLRDGK